MSRNPLKQFCIRRFSVKLENVLRKQYPDSAAPLRILDAGCGEGFLLLQLREWFPNAELVGLDFSEAALKLAKELPLDNVTLCQGDITRLPFEDGAFDLVVCTEVLEHLSAPQDGLNECLRVCAGTAVFTVPNEPWFCLGNLLSLKNVSRLGNPIDHVNHWTYNAFARFVQSACGQEPRQRAASFPWSMVVLNGGAGPRA